MINPNDEPYDFDHMARMLRGVGMSYFRENWPTQAREDWLRHEPEGFQQRFRAHFANWLTKVDRYYAELDQRREAEYQRPPVYHAPPEPDSDDPECE